MSMDPSAPNCAICNAPAYPECPCESERLQVAVKQAEQRFIQARLAEIRNWVIDHARNHILERFRRLTHQRKISHSKYLSELPYYSVYMQYSGHPPLHPAIIAGLQAQISEAHAELKRGIDSDWRASVMEYPKILDYFYGLVDLRLPSERAPSVIEPNFNLYTGLPSPTSKKKNRRSRETSEPIDYGMGPISPVSSGISNGLGGLPRLPGEKKRRESMSYFPPSRQKGPPMAPTPPNYPPHYSPPGAFPF